MSGKIYVSMNYFFTEIENSPRHRNFPNDERYESGLDLRPCLRCGSRRFWFDGDDDEWLCWTCAPPIVENMIRFELTGEFAASKSATGAP
jgi:hypothetical protein